MLGVSLKDPVSGISGVVTAQTVQADGKPLVRIDDHWLDVDGLIPAN